jgi:2,3,4,5-tetrahydropyridine-2-carboxylate N-succinyltransferase
VTKDVDLLRRSVERFADAGGELDDGARAEAREVVDALLDALETGLVRAAVPDGEGWRTEAWVKRGVLLGFRIGEIVEMAPAGTMVFRDKETFPPRAAEGLSAVRIVPGGTAIRRGAYVGDGTILMPPAYVNVGAYVGPSSMIDSHALVGSCAQLGTGIHLSAGAQIGGVLEPPGAVPVVVEDGAFIGALSAVLEGVRVRRGAVIGAGVILTASTPVFDVSDERRVVPGDDGILEIPENAVVIAGTRPLSAPWAREQGLAGAAALIVKRRDEKTDARAALEEALR